MNNLRWKKYHPLTDQNAFICLVEHMGDDSSIVQAARVSYGNDKQDTTNNDLVSRVVPDLEAAQKAVNVDKDRQLIRYLLNHGHTTPFEMVTIKFMVQVPMDCWRQWIRHRTASVNEYSTRYTEAIDAMQVTSPQEWRLQATDNKQGSSGYLDTTVGETFPDPESVNGPKANFMIGHYSYDPMGKALSEEESAFHAYAKMVYNVRLEAGVAKEQARKDLPLSTYTRAYWKCDLHNIFNFLRLRMDSHAQLEIRQFANCMFEIVKQLCPVACEAFEDYVLHAKKFSRMEMEILQGLLVTANPSKELCKHASMTNREWKEFLGKLS